MRLHDVSRAHVSQVDAGRPGLTEHHDLDGVAAQVGLHAALRLAEFVAHVPEQGGGQLVPLPVEYMQHHGSFGRVEHGHHVSVGARVSVPVDFEPVFVVRIFSDLHATVAPRFEEVPQQPHSLQAPKVGVYERASGTAFERVVNRGVLRRMHLQQTVVFPQGVVLQFLERLFRDALVHPVHFFLRGARPSERRLLQLEDRPDGRLVPLFYALRVREHEVACGTAVSAVHGRRVGVGGPLLFELAFRGAGARVLRVDFVGHGYFDDVLSRRRVQRVVARGEVRYAPPHPSHQHGLLDNVAGGGRHEQPVELALRHGRERLVVLRHDVRELARIPLHGLLEHAHRLGRERLVVSHRPFVAVRDHEPAGDHLYLCARGVDVRR